MEEGQKSASAGLPQNSDALKTEKPTEPVGTTNTESHTTEPVNTADAENLAEDARAKIEHDPQTRVAERINYSADDILDETMAGRPGELLTNVKAPDPDFNEELAKTRETLSKNPIVRLFNKENRIVTWSVITAVVVGLVLLITPTLISKKYEYDPNAINPDTGFSNRETDWLDFADAVRGTVNEMKSEDATEPEFEILQYFDELHETYTGVAQRMDIDVIKAEYYESFELYRDALNVLLATDTDYEQPADTDPDIVAYFQRIERYYNLLQSLYLKNGDTGMADYVRQQVEEINTEDNRIYEEYRKYAKPQAENQTDEQTEDGKEVQEGKG